ncbi:endonuclease/exonuclease/phosphatase family protein [bacterium]|nr:endonuclease/exonuclease/phosphatase family protein [bacterium]
MHRLARVLGGLALVLAAGPALASFTPIQLDGEFADWDGLAPLLTDASGDGGTVDFARIWVTNDQDYLYIRFETGGEVQPDEQQDMLLYIDTDDNPATGTAINGIGADLYWEIGGRTGTYKGNAIDHPDIGLMIGPTVSNTEFELALRRDATPNGQALFPAGQISLVLRDGVSQDRAPNATGLDYAFTAGSDVAPTLDLGRNDPDDVRLASWNVQSDALWNGGAAEAAQNRLLDAVDPDVLILCEVWNHSASQTAAKIETFLPSGAGESWSAVKLDQGNVIVSRFPILDSWEVNPGYRITAALLDLGAGFDTDLLVIANHWRCCTDDASRQEEADSVVEFLADMRSPGGVITLPADTPVLLGGDFNLVGWRQQLDTITTGDIVNNGSYGPDAAPDWDGTDLGHALSRHPDGRAGYTWRNDFSSFYPGVLDWIFYTDSVAFLQHDYILETRTMLPATLSANGLLQDDTWDASDHAMRVADFSFTNLASPVPDLAVGARGARLLPNAPNPFNPSTRLFFELAAPATVELRVYDARGALVRRLDAGALAAGVHDVTWDGADDAGRPVASGVYHVQLRGALPGGLVRDVRSIVLVE